ncbi:MAG TPA: cupin domain-containing protein [Bryobacteraceae bacterium]|nr:cupin domain-containing protein [Bryobacteraceae bacterium]
MNRRVVLGSAGAFLVQALISQTASAAGTKTLFEHDLPDLTMNGWQVTAVEVSYKPGESSPPHRHPGITIAYVLEGEIRSKVGDGPEQTYRTGQMFLETPNELHAVSRNASRTKPARLLAVLLAQKGRQLTTPA